MRMTIYQDNTLPETWEYRSDVSVGSIENQLFITNGTLRIHEY